MINSIIAAITTCLKAEFGSRYKVHMEEKKQGLMEPCFFISCINPDSQLFLGKRYMRKNQFCIQYFPETEKKKQECYSIAERLLLCLRQITVMGAMVRGIRMHYEVVEGILHFFINYDMYVYDAEEEIPVMEKLSSKTDVKG